LFLPLVGLPAGAIFHSMLMPLFQKYA